MVRNTREAGLAYVNPYKRGELNRKYKDVIDLAVKSALMRFDLTYPPDRERINALDGVRFAGGLFGWNMYLARRVYDYVLNNQVIDLQKESNKKRTTYYLDIDGLRAYCALTHVYINNPIYPGLTFKDLVLKTKAALGEHELKDKIHDPKSKRKPKAATSKAVADSSATNSTSFEDKGNQCRVVVPGLPVGFPVFDRKQLEKLKEFDVDIFIARLKKRGLIGKIVKLEDIQEALGALRVLRALHDVVLANRIRDKLVFTNVAEFLMYDEITRWIEEYKQYINKFSGEKNLAVMYEVLRNAVSKKPGK